MKASLIIEEKGREYHKSRAAKSGMRLKARMDGAGDKLLSK
jgi:hypothetical protein